MRSYPRRCQFIVSYFFLIAPPGFPAFAVCFPVDFRFVALVGFFPALFLALSGPKASSASSSPNSAPPSSKKPAPNSPCCTVSMSKMESRTRRGNVGLGGWEGLVEWGWGARGVVAGVEVGVEVGAVVGVVAGVVAGVEVGAVAGVVAGVVAGGGGGWGVHQ